MRPSGFCSVDDHSKTGFTHFLESVNSEHCCFTKCGEELLQRVVSMILKHHLLYVSSCTYCFTRCDVEPLHRVVSMILKHHPLYVSNVKK